jgi:prolyl-tRNA editing enzyme YbaK/EbsC (Cys-tRNA(Pro) deacylase)
MQIGNLTFNSISEGIDLLASPIQKEVKQGQFREGVYVTPTDPSLGDTALSLTGMEYGVITPLGLPKDWPILADKKVLGCHQVIIGSGIRGSKILITTNLL